MNKAICEMTLEELREEYLFCVCAAQEEALERSERRYFYDRAIAVKQAIEDFKCID